MQLFSMFKCKLLMAFPSRKIAMQPNSFDIFSLFYLPSLPFIPLVIKLYSFEQLKECLFTMNKELITHQVRIPIKVQISET